MRQRSDNERPAVSQDTLWEQTAITAEVAADGTLQPIGGLSEKLLAAVRSADFPRIRYVVVAAKQPLEAAKFQQQDVKGQVYREYDRAFYLIKVERVTEIAPLLRQLEERYRLAPVGALPERVNDFTGREPLFERVERFVQHRRSGYLVIIGGVGRGKTTFLRELVHRWPEPAIAHFIGLRAATTEPQAIAQSLHHQLLNKYVHHRESQAQQDERDWIQRLQWLLEGLSQAELTERKQPEVLFIDAADQASVDDEGLIPGVLGPLPEGVVAVVTSRTQTRWLQREEAVELCQFSETVKDRTDIRAYLHEQRHRAGLSEDLIERIVHYRDIPPVFYTIHHCLRELYEDKDNARSDQTKGPNPAWWNRAPEERVRDDFKAIVRRAKKDGIDQDTVCGQLALVALSQENISRELYDELGVWETPLTTQVLGWASNFFAPPLDLHRADTVLCFDHPESYRAVLKLTQRQQRRVHQRLAEGCEAVWRDRQSPARGYGLKYGPVHLLGAQQWQRLIERLYDIDYLEQRLAALGEDGLAHAVRDYRAAEAKLSEAVEEAAVSAELAALRGALVRQGHWLAAGKIPPIQALHNDLAGRWGESTRLGRVVREAAARYSGPWLKDLQPPHQESPLWKVLPQETAVNSVAVSPDDQWLASGGGDGTVRLWRVADGSAGPVLEGHADEVRSVAFSGDGQWLASGGEDGTVRLWRVAEDGAEPVLAGHADGVSSVAFSGDGRWLASGGWDGTVRLWRVADGGAGPVLEGHTDIVYSVAFSGDGQWLASAGRDGTVRLWRVAEGGAGPVLEVPAGAVRSVAFSGDGQWLASAGRDGTVRLWRVAEGGAGPVLEVPAGAVRSVAFSGDGQWLASIGLDDTVRLWRVAEDGAGPVLEVPAGAVRSVAFSGDGRWLASAGRDDTVRLWRVAEGGAEPVLEGHADWVESVAFSGDGQWLASAGLDDTVRLWWVAEGSAEPVLEIPAGAAVSVALSGDGRWLTSIGLDDTVRLWRVAEGSAEPVLEIPAGAVLSVALSGDGRWLASIGLDDTVRLWRVADGGSGPVLEGHADGVSSVAFADGVRSVAFSGDGQWLISIDAQSCLYIWPVEGPGTPKAFWQCPHQAREVHMSETADGLKLTIAATDSNNAIRFYRLQFFPSSGTEGLYE